jgi:hypothetical protein
MANEPSKMLERWIQEASDPETDPERLRALANSSKEVVRKFAWKNPNLPEDAWRKALLNGEPGPWANPMAPFYLFAWTPRDDDRRTLEQAALVATERLLGNIHSCSLEVKELLAAKVIEWWDHSESGKDMVKFLELFVHGLGSLSHKEMVRILVLCLQATPNINSKEIQALDFLEKWSKDPLEKWSNGHEPNLDNAQNLVSSPSPVKSAVYYAIQGIDSIPFHAIDDALKSVASKRSSNISSKDYNEAISNHDRLLANLIRQEMPVPPTVINPRLRPRES